MKKRILFLGFILMILGFHVDAQTLKNIHRHNQPVLRIPTHLIDKVETADVQGTPHLRVIQFNGYVSEIPLVQIDSITHSEGEAVDPAQLGNLRTASVMGVVSGPTGAPEMNAIVRSPYGGEETRTDANGVFFLNNILVYDKLGYITITKPGFHQGSRSFLPLETGSNRVNVQLLPLTESGTFSAASGGTVTSGLLQLNFPANAITLYGQPYTGTVRVFAAALDPTSTSMFDQMPGELIGGQNDSLRLLRSFGMASIELRDPNMNELQLATGVSATLTFNIPTELQAEAPANIDWWSFDETLGYWKHEGVAQRQGNNYVGQASHFSWWNCDVPANFNDLIGNVNTADGTPISDAQINVVTANLGTGITYTNSEGVFSGRVPKNQQMVLNVYIACSSPIDWGLAYSETINSQTQSISIEIIASLMEHYPITGMVVDCDSQLVELGYVKIGLKVIILNNGEFNIHTCQLGTNILRGYNASNLDSIHPSELVHVEVEPSGVDIEPIRACLELFNGFNQLIDIDGNVYETVLIGNQWWMARNLATTRFRNGLEIAVGQSVVSISDTNNYRWEYTPDTLSVQYQGLLYNGYVAMDTSGICPVGWHVPTDSDFAELELFIGVPPQEINTNNNSRGSSNNVARKLKVPNYWGGNYGMTEVEPLNNNSTGFSALPSGGAWTPQGWLLMGSGGSLALWTSTESTVTGKNITRHLNASNTGVGRFLYEKRIGYSIRCIKD